MSVALLIEADYPKDEERDKKRVKLSRKGHKKEDEYLV